MKELLCWMGTYRWTYNQCASFSCTHPDIHGAGLERALRAAFVVKSGLVEKGKLWVLETPAEIHNRTVREFVCNLRIQKKNGTRKEKKEI